MSLVADKSEKEKAQAYEGLRDAVRAFAHQLKNPETSDKAVGEFFRKVIIIRTQPSSDLSPEEQALFSALADKPKSLLNG